MPFPLSFVRRFSDYNGQFVLLAKCLSCQHERAIPAPMMARRIGTDAPVAATVRRLRCSKCGGRKVDVLVGGIPR
jgi:hypothetical protein